jgi:hypothetical protein
MNANRKWCWAVVPVVALALGAAPGAQPVEPPAKRAAAHPAPARPAPRPRVQLGKAPQPTFQANNKKFTVDAKAPAARAVRAIPPQAFKSTARAQAVNDFVKKQLAGKPIDAAKLATMKVGPFRNEFVYWAYYNWLLRDRAWWAWNNYDYFDHALWADWMQNEEFAALIDGWQQENKPRILGFVPDQYAGQPAVVIYNDAYLQAVYNPTLTPPSIVIDATPGVELANLVEGATRVVGAQPALITSVTGSTVPLQFVSLPAAFSPTYQIEVKRDGMLYLFGPHKTKLSEGVETDDVANWHAVAKFVAGPGIEEVYQRAVKTGEKIHLHGTEWSVASEQIELFTPASTDAKRTLHSAAEDFSRMLDPKNGFVTADPSLQAHLQSAKDAAADTVTRSSNINEDRLADCHFELARVQKLAQMDLDETKEAGLMKAGKELIRDIKLLQDDMNATSDLRDPSLAVEESATASAGSEEAAPVPARAVVPPEKSDVVPGAEDLLKLVTDGDLTENTTGNWKLEHGQLKCSSSARWSNLRLPCGIPPEYDLHITFVRSGGNQVGIIAKANARFRTEWWIGLQDNKVTELSKTDGSDENATTTNSESGWIKDGMPTHAEIRIRKGQIETLIDGKSVFTTPDNRTVTGLNARAQGASKKQNLCIEIAPNTEVTIQSVQLVEKK